MLKALSAFESFVDPTQAKVVTKPACCAYCFIEISAPKFFVYCEIKASNQSYSLCSKKKQAYYTVS